ncbi:LAFE_0A06876g1_1 [Lachancea fermentati]|uniref:LAFE_0A06876g1_1 n=1 Tax=Lachancea fermentati TaxID=4955 RepID=A0A1G4M780_LACFM|nr:LAFE_0A06876g1_1 [Lachancea fermentati]
MTTAAIATRAACGPAVLLLSSVHRRDSGPGECGSGRQAGLRQRPSLRRVYRHNGRACGVSRGLEPALCMRRLSAERRLRLPASIPTGVLILHGARCCESEFGANSSVLGRRGSAEFCRTGVWSVLSLLSLLSSLSSLSLKWTPHHEFLTPRFPAFSGYTAACRTANCGATRCPVCRGFHVRRAPCSGPLIAHREAVSCVNIVARSLK